MYFLGEVISSPSQGPESKQLSLWNTDVLALIEIANLIYGIGSLLYWCPLARGTPTLVAEHFGVLKPYTQVCLLHASIHRRTTLAGSLRRCATLLWLRFRLKEASRISVYISCLHACLLITGPPQLQPSYRPFTSGTASPAVTERSSLEQRRARC